MLLALKYNILNIEVRVYISGGGECMEEATKARLKGDYRQAFLLSRGDMNQETSLLGIYREAEA